jgi:hypothetical protein
VNGIQSPLSGKWTSQYGIVITRLPVPSPDTATKIPFPYVTLRQLFAAAALSAVQVIPSGLVITRLTPVVETATNRPLPYVTPRHELLSAETREVQVVPSGLVITPLEVPE